MATDIGNSPARTTIVQLGSGQSGLIALADAVTNTAPVILTLKHTTSGTAAAGFGVSSTIDLQSSAGTVRRAATDDVTWTTATDGAEVAKRVINLMVGGTLTAQISIAAGGATNFITTGADATPSVLVGAAADLCGLANVANQLRLCAGGAVGASISAGGGFNSIAQFRHFGATMGIYGAAPVAQYNTTGTATGFVGHAGTAVTHTDTFTGNTGSTAYTIGDIVRALKLLGAMAT